MGCKRIRTASRRGFEGSRAGLQAREENTAPSKTGGFSNFRSNKAGLETRRSNQGCCLGGCDALYAQPLSWLRRVTQMGQVGRSRTSLHDEICCFPVRSWDSHCSDSRRPSSMTSGQLGVSKSVGARTKHGSAKLYSLAQTRVESMSKNHGKCGQGEGASCTGGAGVTASYVGSRYLPSMSPSWKVNHDRKES